MPVFSSLLKYKADTLDDMLPKSCFTYPSVSSYLEMLTVHADYRLSEDF